MKHTYTLVHLINGHLFISVAPAGKHQQCGSLCPHLVVWWSRIEYPDGRVSMMRKLTGPMRKKAKAKFPTLEV